MPRKTTDKKATKSKSKVLKEQHKTSKKDATPKNFPIVGIGASAGGLEALKTFFSKVPEQSGIAYVVVVHMTPKQPSMMPDLLQNITKVPVSAAKDGRIIEPDHIYVIPPNKEISVYQGKIQLLEIADKSDMLPIDLFLRSLAQDQGNNAVAIILSGTGTDGTLGIKEIKSHDGLVLVQTEKTAGYDGMPRSAMSTGLVDMVLPPEEMPPKLVRYFFHSKISIDKKVAVLIVTKQQESLNKIFAILRAQIGHDFSVYKVNTILRRITRRMVLNHIDKHEAYVRFLRKNPNEIDALFRELLIGVTIFFRDSESFDVLKASVCPSFLRI